MQTLGFMSEGEIHAEMQALRLAFRTAHGTQASEIAIRFGQCADEIADRVKVYRERGTDPHGNTVT
jgi:hypothetical protein